jgi:hypothetical protein
MLFGPEMWIVRRKEADLGGRAYGIPHTNS